MQWQLFLAFVIVLAVGYAHAEPPLLQNVALSSIGTKASCAIGEVNPRYPVEGLIDGKLSDETAVRLNGVPSEVVLTFVEEREVNRVRVFPGHLENRSQPSGDCAPLDYEIEGFVNNGWAPLVQVKDTSPPTQQDRAEDCFVDHKFRSLFLSKLRLRVTRSGDTGKRLASPGTEIAPEARTSIIREIQVFETTPGQHGPKPSRKSADFLSGDFRLPYFREQTSARLDLLVREGTPDLPTEIAFKLTTLDGTSLLREFTFPIKPGKNELALEISKLPTGRYLATGTVQRRGESEEITRLLRIDRGRPTLHQPNGTDLTGKVLYPIDDYHAESVQNLSVNVSPAEPHLVTWASISPTKSHWLNKIGPLSATKDNQLAIQFQNLENDQLVWKHALCPDPGQPARWEVHDGPAPKPRESAKLLGPSRKSELKTPIDKATFRFYDRERDGVPALSEIQVFHTGTSRRDFSRLPITYRGTYPIWEKRPGEVLFLSKEALLEDVTLPAGETFEREKDTSDNFGGQMLSEDGQTLFYFVGSVVKRFPPYIVPYDNQRNSNRLFSVYFTRDGFHWEKQFMLPITEKDPWSLQQYGARIFKDPNADLYWGYLSSYHCEKQQMYIDVMFSRDLLHWSRPGDQPLIANTTTPDTGLFGISLPTLPSLVVGDRLYHLMGATISSPHFFFEENYSEEFIQKRLGPRGLNQWPHFEASGGYSGLSKSMQLATTRRPVSIAISRPHGYVSLTARETAGTLVTHPLRASGALTLNAATQPNGSIRIELLSPEGAPLPGYSQEFHGDQLSAPIFAKLPNTPFKVKLKLRNARVFCLQF